MIERCKQYEVCGKKLSLRLRQGEVAFEVHAAGVGGLFVVGQLGDAFLTYSPSSLICTEPSLLVSASFLPSRASSTA